MAKPRPARIPSDACVVTVDGEEYHVHEGESITLIPVTTTKELRIFNTFASLEGRMAAVEGDDDEAMRKAEMLNEAFSESCTILSNRILSWDWTDMAGEPLPQPARNPDVIEALTTEEMFYLIQVLRGDDEASRKNDSRPLQTTGSDTEPVPIQTHSAKGRSRTTA